MDGCQHYPEPPEPAAPPVEPPGRVAVGTPVSLEVTEEIRTASAVRDPPPDDVPEIYLVGGASILEPPRCASGASSFEALLGDGRTLYNSRQPRGTPSHHHRQPIASPPPSQTATWESHSTTTEQPNDVAVGTSSTHTTKSGWRIAFGQRDARAAGWPFGTEDPSGGVWHWDK
jgi:hypothetical protein